MIMVSLNIRVEMGEGFLDQQTKAGYDQMNGYQGAQLWAGMNTQII